MKRIIPQLLIAVFIGILFFCAGIRFESMKKTEIVVNKENIRTIAVVNMDQGVQVKDKVMNYGTQLISFSNDYFYNTSLQEAQKGVENGKYAAYVIIPAVFSERVWSINTKPEKAVLEYALNPNLREDIVPEVIYDLKGFEMKINADISYLYLYSILEEFHGGQDSAVTVMGNDKEDIKNLSDIIAEEFMEPLKFVELQRLEEFPQEMHLGAELENMAGAGNELERQYERLVDQAKEELDRLFDGMNPVVGVKDGLYTAISKIRILEDGNGGLIFGDGKNQLYSGIEEHGSSLMEERNFIKDMFHWIARRDPLENTSVDEGTSNTWLAEIQQQQKSEREAYNEALETWRNSFDYSKLATPSEATPSNATPSDATPSDINSGGAGSTSEMGNWLLDRDLAVVRIIIGNLYGRIEADLEHLGLEEEQLDLILSIIWQNCMDEDILKAQVATASDANPVMGSPDADVYIRGFFDSMPIYNGDLQEVLDRVGQKMVDFAQTGIEYMSSRAEGLFEWFRNIFDVFIEEKLDIREKELQDDMTKELNQFADTFDEYHREFKRYTPFQETEGKGRNWFKGILDGNLSEVEKKINDKSKADEELIIKIEKSKETDIEALQNSIDTAYEGTSEKLKDSLETVMSKKKKTNEENKGLLHGFTQKLPYTRNGSAADTDTYEFIAKPLELNERKLSGRNFSNVSQRFSIERSTATGVFCIIIIGLAIQNVQFRRREKKRQEEQNSL